MSNKEPIREQFREMLKDMLPEMHDKTRNPTVEDLLDWAKMEGGLMDLCSYGEVKLLLDAGAEVIHMNRFLPTNSYEHLLAHGGYQFRSITSEKYS